MAAKPQKVRAVNSLDFPDGLGLVFIALKLAGCIGWSWVWVLAPLWISCIAQVLAELTEEKMNV